MESVRNYILIVFVLCGLFQRSLVSFEPGNIQNPAQQDIIIRQNLTQDDERAVITLLDNTDSQYCLSEALNRAQEWLQRFGNLREKECALTYYIKGYIIEKYNLGTGLNAYFDIEHNKREVSLEAISNRDDDDAWMYDFNSDQTVFTQNTITGAALSDDGSQAVLYGYKKDLQFPMFYLFSVHDQHSEWSKRAKCLTDELENVIASVFFVKDNPYWVVAAFKNGKIYLMNMHEEDQEIVVDDTVVKDYFSKQGIKNYTVERVTFEGNSHNPNSVKMFVSYSYKGEGAPEEDKSFLFFETTLAFSQNRKILINNNRDVSLKKAVHGQREPEEEGFVVSKDGCSEQWATKGYSYNMFKVASQNLVVAVARKTGDAFIIDKLDGTDIVQKLYFLKARPELQTPEEHLKIMLRHYLSKEKSEKEFCPQNIVPTNNHILVYFLISYLLNKKIDPRNQPVTIPIDSIYNREIVDRIIDPLKELLFSQNYIQTASFDPSQTLLARTRRYVRQHPVQTALAVASTAVTVASVVDRIRTGDWRNTRRQLERARNGIAGLVATGMAWWAEKNNDEEL